MPCNGPSTSHGNPVSHIPYKTTIVIRGICKCDRGGAEKALEMLTRAIVQINRPKKLI